MGERRLRYRNFLSPRLDLNSAWTKAPKASISFRSLDQLSGKGINLSVAVCTVKLHLRIFLIPGDKLVFNDFLIRHFLLMRIMENYLEIDELDEGSWVIQNV